MICRFSVNSWGWTITFRILVSFSNDKKTKFLVVWGCWRAMIRLFIYIHWVFGSLGR